MRSTSYALLIALTAGSACDRYTGEKGGDDTDTDAGGDTDVVVDEPTYLRPVAAGKTTSEGIDPHSPVFGSVQFVDETEQALPVGPEPLHVHLGLPRTDSSTSVSFVWSTDVGTLASQVQLREGADLAATDFTEDDTFDGVSYLYGGSDDNKYRIHELQRIGTMSPGTTYSYRVGGASDTEEYWSEVYTFTMPLTPGTFDTYTVAFAGDSRGSYEQWGTLVAQMEAADPDIVLFSGDMVEFGTNENEWYAWWEATNDAFAERFFLPAIGNHEFLATNYFAHFSLPGNEKYFDLRFGSFHVAALIDIFVDQAVKDFEQTQFMRDTIGKSDAAWKFGMHHIPIYSICSRHASDEELRASWESTFEEVGMDFVFAGHNHIYERSVPIKDGQETPGGTRYMVSGGAGAPLYESIDEGWWNVVATPKEHFILGQFDATGVKMTVKDIQGNSIDDFTVAVDE